MKKTEWFERQFRFGLPHGMLPFYIERLQGTSIRIEVKVNGLPEHLLSHRLDGKWSVKENIGHLADVDRIAIKRIGEMMKGTSPMTPAVIQPQQDYNQQPVMQVIEHFKECRAQNLALYKNLADADLGKVSFHPRLKVNMTPVDLAYFDAEHDDHHLVRINEIIAGLIPKPT